MKPEQFATRKKRLKKSWIENEHTFLVIKNVTVEMKEQSRLEHWQVSSRSPISENLKYKRKLRGKKKERRKSSTK